MKRSAELARSPMKRTTELRRTPAEARLTVPVPKARRCKVCKEPATSRVGLLPFCSPGCGLELAKRVREKQKAAEAAKERATTRERREAIKTRSEWLKEAKQAIQAARRLEELAKGRGCMSCGRSQAEVIGTDAWRPGGYFDGGHFMSKGACPELAVEPLNIWLQCKPCNAGSGKYAHKGRTVAASFEANLIEHEGQALVDWLKGPHPPAKFDIPALKAIRDIYRAKTKALKQQQETAA